MQAAPPVDRTPSQRLLGSRQKAIVVVSALILATLAVDLSIPKDLDLSVFYALSIAACAWGRSPRLLWLATTTDILLIFADLKLGGDPIHADDPWWLHLANRSFIACAMLVLASIVHLWMRSSRALEENRRLLARQNEQLRAGGAELERRVQARTRELEAASKQRQETEAALHQAQKMEAVGQLTGGVAHDFNNLLTVIAGNAELLRRRAEGGRERRQAEAILQAADRGENLTRQLLAFSRRQALHPEVLELRQRTHAIADLLARSLREDIRIGIAVADDLWPIEVDPGELELALLNIGVNARDAMPDGGILRIEAHNVAFGQGDDRENGLVGDYVALTLSDTGSGIDPAILAHVFEPFFTTKETGKGSGLGLSQVYGFARQSGGAVSLRSEPGRGTAVTLHLPRARRRAPAAVPEPAAASAPAAGAILYIEDNPQVATVTEEMLNHMGYRVCRVDDPRAALAILDAGRGDDGQGFDLVLSDIVMPGGISGVDLARELRARFPALPVLLTTGYSKAADDVEQEGLVILAKPYRTDALADAIARCLTPR